MISKVIVNVSIEVTVIHEDAAVDICIEAKARHKVETALVEVDQAKVTCIGAVIKKV